MGTKGVGTEYSKTDAERGVGALTTSPSPPTTTGPINYIVSLKKPEVHAYWDAHRDPESNPRHLSLLGYKMRESTQNYALLAEGIPALRFKLQELLESKGFTGVTVIPDDTWPYEWLR